jgi:hypothetical protein
MLFGKYISTEVAPSLPEDGIQKRYRIAGEKLRRVSFCGWLGQEEDES